MHKAPEEKPPPAEPVEEPGTLPQWQPPASATRTLPSEALAPVATGATNVVAVVPPPVAAAVAHAVTAEAPAISGSRPAQLGNKADAAVGLEHTLQAGGAVSLEPPRPLAVGDIVADRYVVEQHISSGGFGAVYRASDRQIRNHQVALKVLHKPAADAAARETALRELTLIASVSHPSVVQFKDYGWLDGRLWFAMPWYRGETLDQRFRDSDGTTAITRTAARPLFERLARGLAAMHAVGIQHYDIKPENIFVADIAGFDGGLPVLLDLGIATQRGEGPRGLTAEYAAPEVAQAALGKRDRPIGDAADVFSLALVLRNLLEPETMERAEGELLPLLHRRGTEPIEPPSRRELRYLKPYFERWLNLDPAVRPTAEELAAELAVLTEPEERREARKRLLRRLVPIVLLAAAAVTVLLLQVNKQKTELIVQREKLTQQQLQSAQLRQQSSAQLQQLEAASAQIGTQGQQLQRAIAIARKLDDRLESEEDRAEKLQVRVRKLTEEGKVLTSQRDALTRERDELVGTQKRLEFERDALQDTRRRLERERDSLTVERDTLIGERDRIEAERESVAVERNELARRAEKLDLELGTVRRRLDETVAERDQINRSFEAARDELKEARSRLRDAEQERLKLDRERRRLERELEARGGKAPPP